MSVMEVLSLMTPYIFKKLMLLDILVMVTTVFLGIPCILYNMLIRNDPQYDSKKISFIVLHEKVFKYSLGL